MVLVTIGASEQDSKWPAHPTNSQPLASQHGPIRCCVTHNQGQQRTGGLVCFLWHICKPKQADASTTGVLNHPATDVHRLCVKQRLFLKMTLRNTTWSVSFTNCFNMTLYYLHASNIRSSGARFQPRSHASSWGSTKRLDFVWPCVCKVHHMYSCWQQKLLNVSICASFASLLQRQWQWWKREEKLLLSARYS